MDWSIIVIICIFLVFYIATFIDQKTLITDPKEILIKFLAVVFLYAGISLIYFSITGSPLFTTNTEVYNVYIFIIGFIALLWTIPFLIKDYSFYRKWFKKGDPREDIKLKVNHKRNSK
ncbi:hypothetical protein HOD38_00300 [archaeon]|jgi:hypothetical protein|nr:hypothetical protein [archaeon]MBT4396687.1 hypothetical protein [archaeon]MBT4441297.1 hypothetical protein [archaeon]